jgi:hypothetical protein
VKYQHVCCFDSPNSFAQDLDGRELEFLGATRRFLYFRYIMTYLYYKKLGRIKWASQIEAHGYMWATPGRYLRQSMLQVLARQVSDHYLPEVFWKTDEEHAD